MASVDYRVRDNPSEGRFEVEVEGHLAIAEYRLKDGLVFFTHTEVPDALEGRGVGKALVLAGLQAARDRGLKVVPLCSFFAAYMKRHPETHDLLNERSREQLGLPPLPSH